MGYQLCFCGLWSPPWFYHWRRLHWRTRAPAVPLLGSGLAFPPLSGGTQPGTHSCCQRICIGWIHRYLWISSTPLRWQCDCYLCPFRLLSFGLFIFLRFIPTLGDVALSVHSSSNHRLHLSSPLVLVILFCPVSPHHQFASCHSFMNQRPGWIMVRLYSFCPCGHGRNPLFS